MSMIKSDSAGIRRAGVTSLVVLATCLSIAAPSYAEGIAGVTPTVRGSQLAGAPDTDPAGSAGGVDPTGSIGTADPTGANSGFDPHGAAGGFDPHADGSAA